MSTITYEAVQVGIDYADDAVRVGFGEFPNASGYPTAGLILSRSTDPAEDVPGVAGVYTEWNGQENGCYGCIEHVELTRRSIGVTFKASEESWGVLRLHPGAAGRGEGDRLTELQITFSLDDATFQELRRALHELIFINCDCFSLAEQGRATRGSTADRPPPHQ